MDNQKLVAAIEDYEGRSENGEISQDRIDSLDYYLGKPMGNEVDGRSQVISRTVWDTVEWVKPQIADIFCGGDDVVLFSANGPNDVKAAEQETDYVNYVITAKNPWFEIWNAWSHDALVQKNGYVKAYWDDSENITTEEYDDLTDEEYAVLMQDPDIEIVEHEHEVELDEMTGVVTSEHSVKLKRKEITEQVRIENLPPEYVLVDPNARGLSLNHPSCNFVEHYEYKTISQLRLDGFEVDDDISDAGSGYGDWENDNRNDDSPFANAEGSEVDPAMRRVKVRECWMRVDFDDDGFAELRHIVIVGTIILLNEECEFVPIASLCPSPMSHRHFGQSIADAVMDLQRIQTALLRGALDNQYLANNGRYAVSDAVNLDDMLDSRPGGVVRVDGDPNAHILPLNHSTNGGQVIPMMEYVDRIAQKRTGISDQTMGINPNALNNQAGAQANMAMMTAAQQRIKFIARVFAETGVKQLFLLVHALTLKHSRQEEMVELRGNWVPVNPSQWRKRSDMRISVGIGMGDKGTQLAFLTSTLQAQMQLLPMGVSNPGLIYNTVSRLAKVAGYKDTSEFWQNPAQLPPPPPPPPPPQVMIEQMRIQADAQRFQAEMQAKFRAMEIEANAKLAELEANLKLQASNDLRDAEREQTKLQLEAQFKATEQESKQMLERLKLDMDKYKADLASQTQIYIEQMRQYGQVGTGNTEGFTG